MIDTLDMRGYIIEVSASPDQPNTFYEVKHRSDIDTDLNEVLSSLREKRITAPHVIVYCPSVLNFVCPF